MMKKLNLGMTVKILTDAISLSALNEMDGEKFYQANKKRLQRIKKYDGIKMNEKDIKHFYDFGKKIDEWAIWAKQKGYLKEFQQTAITDFFLTMVEVAEYDMPLDKNMAEHFFCYALAKVLFLQVQEQMKSGGDNDRYFATCKVLSRFELFGNDENYNSNFAPIASSFGLLTYWVKDLNELMDYWEDIIAKNGKRDNPPNLKSYLLKWRKGTSPSWNILKLFFDNDLCPPADFFVEDKDICEKGYMTFKANLFMSFIITNLFDSLEKEEILSKESRIMIRDGARLYFRDFFIIRKDSTKGFEMEAKKNLMFRTLFCMLEGNLSNVDMIEYLRDAYEIPDIPLLSDEIDFL
ncbi:MAG: hypothetical protein ILP07_09350 [Treponema sp.]|nr:hypothetical protein [Treponema sp.]